ncbi:hypothetical protein [Mycobacterium aquaticum]|uniref:Uncharacterized protein n=1 Tax=Mycobacterium aquaticum TaxID=1927124 RepID=A0A1X0A4J4_9MYCO|nr:hypothetical protein [Mycobacterium aquaticum]ORA24922.1 hypothetical protein BST13_33680 [Mycobacterium aquaticum]
MTRPPACEYGPSGWCSNGSHDKCAHRVGGPMERGSWQPECYLTIPPKRGHRGTEPIPADGLDNALVIPGRGVAVIRPSHVWHCPCECHTAGPPIGAQLNLFEEVLT